MTKSREHARLLLAKADEDLYVLERLASDRESPDAVIGFHAQQAAEQVGRVEARRADDPPSPLGSGSG